MRTRIRYSLVLVFCGLSALIANAQMSLVKGVPFEATRTRIINLPGDNYTVSSMVARSSNGSTYKEHRDPKTGELDLINIIDVPGNRGIVLDVKHKFYSIQPLNLATVGSRSSDEAQQKYVEYLKTLKPTRTQEEGYETETTPLGFRTQNGFLEFGRRMVFDNVSPSSSIGSLKQKTWEDWWAISLSIFVEKIGFDADNKPVQITKISNIRTEEPDPRLFEIPPGYTPWPVHSSK